MIAELLTIIAPIFICVALGFGWARSGRPYDQEFMTALIMNIGAPCLVFSELVSLEVERQAMIQLAGGALAAMLVSAGVGAVVLRLARLPAHTFLSPLIYGNVGNMGLPLCLFAFGREGLGLAACFFSTMCITHVTVGVWIWSGRASMIELLRTPLSYAAVLAVAVIATGVSVPLWILNTTELLGGLAIPLMLLTLGVSLGGMQILRLPRTLALSVLRLGMGFAIGVALSVLLDLEGVPRGVMIIECSMPAAVLNYLFAQRYQRSPEDVASIIILSTAISFVLLPFLLAWLL